MGNETFNYDVFLSHNSKDKPAVHKLAERLRGDGLQVWFDDWVVCPGDDIYLAIEKGLEESRILVLVMSSNTFGSDWVSLERATSLFRDPANRQRRFIPLLLTDCEIPDVLRRYKFIDYRKKGKSAYRDLLVSCGAEQIAPEFAEGVSNTIDRNDDQGRKAEPPSEFVRELKDRIRSLLDKSSARSLCDAIVGDGHHPALRASPAVIRADLEGQIQRLKQKIAECQSRWDLLDEMLAELREQEILETQANQKFNLKKQIERRENEHSQVEQELQSLQKQLSDLEQGPKEQQRDGSLAADILFPQQGVSPIDSLDLLHHATKKCLQNPGVINDIKAVAREIFGWLVLLAIDRDQLNASKYVFDPWKDGIQVAIPLETEAGTEVLMSSLGDRAADPQLKWDNKGRPRVVGKDSFAADDLEHGLGQSDQLAEIQKRIWVEVMKGTAPVPFGQVEQNQLRSILATRERQKRSHYYITVPPERHGSPLSNKELLSNLLKALPSLRVIYIGKEKSEGILVMDEFALWGAIHEFLLMLRKYQ